MPAEARIVCWHLDIRGLACRPVRGQRSSPRPKGSRPTSSLLLLWFAQCLYHMLHGGCIQTQKPMNCTAVSKTWTFWKFPAFISMSFFCLVSAVGIPWCIYSPCCLSFPWEVTASQSWLSYGFASWGGLAASSAEIPQFRFVWCCSYNWGHRREAIFLMVNLRVWEISVAPREIWRLLRHRFPLMEGYCFHFPAFLFGSFSLGRGAFPYAP